MKKFLKTFLMTFFAMLLSLVVIVLLVVGIVAMSTGGGPDIEDDSWLVIALQGPLPEYAPPTGLMSAVQGGSPASLQSVLENLRKARADDRITGVILKMDSGLQTGTASIQEIRDEIRKVRDGGKQVLAYAESLDTRTAYLAASCERIYAPPSGYVFFRGMSMSSMHVQGTLEKLGIKPNIHKIKDYKSAAEMVIRKDMSGPARENREWLLAEFWENLVTSLQEDRGLDEDRIVALMEKAIFEADEAREAGLLDELMYWDELKDSLKGEDVDDEEELETVSGGTYAAVDPADLDLGGDRKIAVVHAQGNIAGRKSRVDPLLGIMMGYESVVADLRAAEEDEDVAAIVFRVDSGGGDGYASDIMGHAVEAIAANKPVVVSMGDVAASGGYSIAYRATRVIADPMTITGSIGSISGKFNMSGLYDKVGLSYDHVTKGPMAMFFTDERDFTPEEWERFTENHWRSFNRWLADVAEHRGMSFEEAEKLAHGRVWTGRQAAENGLVDELGGLDRAVEIAKELAGIESGEQVTMVHYPLEKGFLETIMGGGDMTRAATNWLLYRFIHEDLAETWRTLERGDLHLMEAYEVR